MQKKKKKNLWCTCEMGWWQISMYFKKKNRYKWASNSMWVSYWALPGRLAWIRCLAAALWPQMTLCWTLAALQGQVSCKCWHPFFDGTVKKSFCCREPSQSHSNTHKYTFGRPDTMLNIEGEDFFFWMRGKLISINVVTHSSTVENNN